MRGQLEAIVQRLEENLTVPRAEGQTEEVIRQRGVLGQQRAMNVGPHHSTTDGPFSPVLAVIAKTSQHRAQWTDRFPQAGAPPPGLEPHPQFASPRGAAE